MKKDRANPATVAYSVRNTVLVALLQTTLVTLCVLFGATALKLGRTIHGTEGHSGLAAFWAVQGIWLLWLPPAWTLAALLVRRRDDVRPHLKFAAFLVGLVVASGLGLMLLRVIWLTLSQFFLGEAFGAPPGE